MAPNKKEHWNHVYETKQAHEVSWTQEIPTASLEFFHQFNLPKSAKIIDVGGGDSKLVDYLLREGYQHISVLDISSKALEKAKKRLGKDANKVNWIVADIEAFEPNEIYDLWHDRATFHFLTSKEQVEHYLAIAKRAIGAYLIVATFSEKGPEKCSGLPIKQYSETDLENQFKQGFHKIKCQTIDHLTPFQTTQNFTFCSFRKQIPAPGNRPQIN